MITKRQHQLPLQMGFIKGENPHIPLTFTYRFRQDKNRQRGRRGSYGDREILEVLNYKAILIVSLFFFL